MVNILQTEFFRLKKSRLFWVLFAVCAVLPLISVFLNVGISVSLTDTDMGVDYDIWELMKSANVTVAMLSSLPSLSGQALYALICTSIFLSKEFSGGTFRNMLLANRSRRDVFLSFLLMAITIGATYMGVSFVSTLLFSGAIFGFGPMSAGEAVSACALAFAMGLVSVIFLQTLMCLFMFSTRKLAVALTCPLVLCIIVPAFLYSFIQAFAQFGLITVESTSWIPLYNLLLLDFTATDGALIGKILLYIVPLTVLFGVMGWVFFRKADLK